MGECLGRLDALKLNGAHIERLMGNRLTAGQGFLVPFIKVRILVSQLLTNSHRATKVGDEDAWRRKRLGVKDLMSIRGIGRPTWL